MPDLTSLPHELKAGDATCRAIIETPKGSRNKFSYNPETGLFKRSLCQRPMRDLCDRSQLAQESDHRVFLVSGQFRFQNQVEELHRVLERQ